MAPAESSKDNSMKFSGKVPAAAADAANRLTQFGQTHYTFDDHGQTATKSDAQGTSQYQWDARGRLSRVNLPGGQVVTYGYDAVGRRASRSVSPSVGASPVTTNFIYDGADVVVDQNQDNPVEYLNGPGIDNKLKVFTSTSSLNFLQDHLSTTIALTNNAGGVVERQEYEPHGRWGND